MLDTVELQLVQDLEAKQREAITDHTVPALEGDFLQLEGRRATRILLNGILSSPDARDDLEQLRQRFRDALPVPFVSDITTATKVDQAMIERLAVRERAGWPDQFEYAIALVEYTPATPTAQQQPAAAQPAPPAPSLTTGTVDVEVTVAGQPGFDMSHVTVSIQGTTDDGTALTRTLTDRTDATWTDADMPPGKYTAKAVVSDPQAMAGSADVEVQAGATAKAVIMLTPGAVIAHSFVVHFGFDRAFIEPCCRAVMRDAAGYARDHPDEKLVIAGHTDLAGSDAYNQSLSERRARSVHAYLTFGSDRAAALAEWNALRQARPAGELPSVKDGWGVAEYQFMLQDLDFYRGNVDGIAGPVTDAAVRGFQQAKGLAVDGVVGDNTWNALITAYIERDGLAVQDARLMENCPGSPLKWIGCGEQSPVRNTADAWRPNRRVELLFVKAAVFPCQVPKPDTFDLPAAGAGGAKWCLGPGDPNARACFIARQPDGQAWLVQPVNADTIAVQGTIKREDGQPAAGVKYVLTAPDGEYLDGEVASGPDHGRPIPGTTKPDGSFGYADKPKGVYGLAVVGNFTARLSGQPSEAATGNALCARLDGTTSLDVVIAPGQTGDPTRSLDATLFDDFGQALAGLKVDVLFPDGTRSTASTDGQGAISLPMASPQTTARLSFTDPGDPSDVNEFDFFIDPGPIDADDGMRRRLHNLGYPADDDFAGSITAFQAAQGLDPSGQVDDATRSKLAAVHDGVDRLVREFPVVEEPVAEADLTLF